MMLCWVLVASAGALLGPIGCHGQHGGQQEGTVPEWNGDDGWLAGGYGEDSISHSSVPDAVNEDPVGDPEWDPAQDEDDDLSPTTPPDKPRADQLHHVSDEIRKVQRQQLLGLKRFWQSVLDKRMSMMRLRRGGGEVPVVVVKTPRFSPRLGPSMIRLKKPTMMRLKKVMTQMRLKKAL